MIKYVMDSYCKNTGEFYFLFCFLNQYGSLTFSLNQPRVLLNVNLRKHISSQHMKKMDLAKLNAFSTTQ